MSAAPACLGGSSGVRYRYSVGIGSWGRANPVVLLRVRVAAISGSLVGVFLDQFDLVCQVRGAAASSEKRSPLLQAPIRRCALFWVGLDMRGPLRVLVKEWGGAAVQFLSPRIRLRRR